MIDVLSYHLISYSSFVYFLLFVVYVAHSSHALYFHRYICHRQITISAWYQHFLRFIIFLTSPVWSKDYICYYIARHRLHHRYSDTDRDVSNPKFGFWFLLTKGTPVSLEDLKKYGEFFLEPKDVASRFYKRNPWVGVMCLVILCTILAGLVGFVVGLLLIPFQKFYETAVDYCYHSFGYKNPQVKGNARNVTCIAIVEGLHSNHHVRPWDPKCSHRWFEIDLFYGYMLVLHWLYIIRIKQLDQTNYFEKKFDI